MFTCVMVQIFMPFILCFYYFWWIKDYLIFKVYFKVMLAPANYVFLFQEFCLFVCLQARKKDAQVTFKIKKQNI